MSFESCYWFEFYGGKYNTTIKPEMLSPQGLEIQRLGNSRSDKRGPNIEKRPLLVKYDTEYVIAKLRHELRGCIAIYPDKVDAIFAQLLAESQTSEGQDAG